MHLPWKSSIQDPRYTHCWRIERGQLDYWLFGLLLLVVIAILYGLIALTDAHPLDRFISQSQSVGRVAACCIPRV
jgi:hypothetical protein